MPSAALFVRSASPGAVLRFLERRNDENPPAEVLLSDAVGEKQWRVLLATPEYLFRVAGPLSVAFPPECLVATREERNLTVQIFREGRMADLKTDAGSGGKPGWVNWGAFNALSDVSATWRWAREQGLPTTRWTKPPRVIDYATVAVLDQRKLLVEDSPRLYRFPLC